MSTQTLTAYPVVSDVPANIAFLTAVLGAVEKVRAIGGAGGFHTELEIGDTLLMLGGGGAGADGKPVAWNGAPRPMAFHVYVRDVDATYQTALAHAAISLQPPTEQPWGERTASIKDPAGNFWYLATFHGENYFSEGAPTVQPFLQPVSAEPVIDFLVAAFDAVELGRATSPEGKLLHTTLRIGTSAMELIDAVGIYQPMPGMFYLYVDDADASYARALAAGAESKEPPADRPYGDRNAAVQDTAGNLWYIASHIA